ncbi:MAG: Txe/YoeB family addiction module toxin [Bacteroidaceae bacterium]|nr:Txe/YoeB family addiction module toxin [Bacteroidaceae bacterium]
MQYYITYSERAQEGLAKLKRSEPSSFKKAMKLLNELAFHPCTGTGHPEPLRGDRAGQWSRQITKKHRLVYEIFETEVHVDVLAAYGHYDDK